MKRTRKLRKLKILEQQLDFGPDPEEYNYEDYITKTDILKRGWNEELFQKYLPEPHVIGYNSETGVDVYTRFYYRDEVLEIEQRPFFLVDVFLGDNRVHRFMNPWKNPFSS